MKTAESIAQYAVDSRYSKGEGQRISDFELYHEILDAINALTSEVKTRKAKASQLIFLGQVKRDGTGIVEVSEAYKTEMLKNPLMKDELFEINVLSLTEKTYTASGFNTFVVKLRD